MKLPVASVSGVCECHNLYVKFIRDELQLTVHAVRVKLSRRLDL